MRLSVSFHPSTQDIKKTQFENLGNGPTGTQFLEFGQTDLSIFLPHNTTDLTGQDLLHFHIQLEEFYKALRDRWMYQKGITP